MATLSELYAYLEEKRDSSHIDCDITWSSFPENEREESRLEILTWWKIERIVEDENCQIDRKMAKAYFDRRIAATNNQFLVYRYSYFAYLLSNNRTYAEKAVDALIGTIGGLFPQDLDDYPSGAKDAIETLLTLSKRIKYRQADSKTLIWSILDGNYGCLTKLVILEEALQVAFFDSSDAKRIADKCKQLHPQTYEYWTEKCCLIGLHYAATLQTKGKSYVYYFNEALGDLEMAQLEDITSEPNNIVLPHLNDRHLERAMQYYKEAGATLKMLGAQRKYNSNKKNLKYLRFVSTKETDEHVVTFFRHLNENLLKGRFNHLMWNLAIPVQFLFPSMKMIRERMSDVMTNVKHLGFTDKIKDINGNNQDAGEEFSFRRMYETWLLNIVRNPVLELILSAIKQKKLTYAKVKNWMTRTTCFGLPIEFTRNNDVVTASWFSQIDYAVKALIQQYQRTIDKKPTDWRIPIEVLSIRFEGILRCIVNDQGGQTIKTGRNGNTSEALLDDLLRAPCLLNVFTEDDVDFFEYVLTSKGLNIRNNVAHAFYIPQDYGITQATLVFLCVLRLTKFLPK